MRPTVGITAWRRRLETFYGPDTLQTLSCFYTESLSAAGMTPVLFPSSLKREEAPALVAMVDGVVLSGGDDVDPASYDTDNTSSQNISRAADDFEIAVVMAAREQGKPLLAICRGLQLLNVSLGGTLSQEVTSADGVHDLITRDHVEMNARRHVVTFEEDAVLADVYRSAETKVNSLHHQGIDRLADGLVVEGRSDDGLVEAARVSGDWWALGVQWHPERMDGAHQQLFSEFRKVVEDASR